MSDYIVVNGELYHYGVLGMKWGVHRAQRKMASNERLKKKANKFDVQSAKLAKKSEKQHADHDLEGGNKKGVKAAKLDVKAAKLRKKADKQTSEHTSARLNKKASKLEYKSSKLKIEGDRISKTSGYGAKAMKYSIKSDVAAKKAAKARMRMANNELYIERMQKKVSSISQEDLKGAYAFCNDFKRR